MKNKNIIKVLAGLLTSFVTGSTVNTAISHEEGHKIYVSASKWQLLGDGGLKYFIQLDPDVGDDAEKIKGYCMSKTTIPTTESELDLIFQVFEAQESHIPLGVCSNESIIWIIGTDAITGLWYHLPKGH